MGNRDENIRMKGPAATIAFSAALAMLATFAIYTSGGVVFSHDIFYHTARAEQFFRALGEGVLLPRWADTEFGHGSPAFLFYQPGIYYLTSLFMAAGASATLSLKLTSTLAFFLSGITMHAFVRDNWDEKAALTATAAYVLMPYHILDLYVRGAVPELYALAFLPLLLMLAGRLSRDAAYMPLLAIAYAVLSVTHHFSAFVYLPVVIAYGIYASNEGTRWRGAVRVFGAVLLGLCIAAFFLLPLVTERSFIHNFYYSTGEYDYRKNFLLLAGELSKNKSYLVLNAIGITHALILYSAVRSLRSEDAQPGTRFFTVLLGIGIFMMLPISRPLWAVIPGFSFLGFPWRFLMYCLLSSAVLIGALHNKLNKGIAARAAIVLFVIISVVVIFGMKFTPADVAARLLAHPYIQSPVELRPVWVRESDRMLREELRASVISGRGSVEIVDWKTEERFLKVRANGGPVTVRLSTFYYPGWRADADGVHIDVSPQGESGSLVFKLPAGKHAVRLSFGDTHLRASARKISLAALGMLGILVIGIAADRKRTRQL